MDGKIQVWIDQEVYCWVDLNTNEIYSAKLHKLKGQTMPEHNMKYFMIKYNGKKKYIALDRLISLAQTIKATQAKGE